MPTNFVRKTNRQRWSEEAMAKAIEAIREKNFGYQNAAKTFGVPKTTLERRVKGQNKYAIGNKKFLGSKMLTFTPELEKELAIYISNMETMVFVLTSSSVRSIAYQLAV